MAVKKKKVVKKAVKRAAKGRTVAAPTAKAPAKGKTSASDPSRELARKIASVVSDHKGIDIAVLDLRGLTSFTDFFVIASGASDRQVEAIAAAVREELKRGGRLPISEEGLRSGHWALIDYGDVVTHVFYHTDRDHYQLEKLWSDAPRVTFRGIS